MINNQNCLPAIASMKDYEKFLKSSLEWCILLDFHISLIEGMIKDAHKVDKKVIVHLDLIKGISTDEYGCEFICQKYKCDGIISTKSKVIESAKKNKKIAIQRMFLIDSRSLEKGYNQLKVSRPDYVEILPGIAYEILPEVKGQLQMPLMSGGLIKDYDMINRCIDYGATLVSVGSVDLAISYASK